MTARLARPARFLPRRAALVSAVAALPLLLAACGGPGPTVAPATATVSGSAVSGRFTLATLIPATAEPVTATAPSAATILPRPTAATTGTTAPAATAPGTTRPAGTAVGTNAPGATSGPAGSLATWIDPAGGIRLQYPANWRATLPASSTDSDLQLTSPNQLLFTVIIFAPTGGQMTPSVDDVVKFIQDSHTSSQQWVYTDSTPTDVTVAGERGKTLEYGFVPRANRTAPTMKGRIWIVPRGDRVYVLQASNIGTAQTEVDAIINSVMFAAPRPATTSPGGSAVPAGTRTPPAPSPAAASPSPAARGTGSASAPVGTAVAAPTGTPRAMAAAATPISGPATFSDRDRLVTLEYPRGWQTAASSNDPMGGFYEFDGPDGALLFVTVADRATNLDDAMRDYQDSQSRSMVYKYTFGQFSDAKVAGEGAKTMTYTYTPLTRMTERANDGVVWLVIRGGKLLTFDFRNLGTHRPEADAMIASVKLK